MKIFNYYTQSYEEVALPINKTTSPEEEEEDGSLIKFATKNSEPYSKILLPSKPHSSTQYAAEELQSFIKQSLNVILPIEKTDTPFSSDYLNQKAIILLPDTEREKNGFHLYIEDNGKKNHLIISGSPERGILYGVYEILEKFLGIRWYTSWHTVIPDNYNTLSIPNNYNDDQKPAIEFRTVYWYDCIYNHQFAGRLRINRVGEKYGGDPFAFGGGLGNCHTFNTLLPSSEFGVEHPEYFALKNGARLVNNDSQPCLSNPNVLKIVIERVLERIRKDVNNKKNYLVYGVSQNDNRNFCECDNCKAIDEEEESNAGCVVRFVNAVADEVKKEFPGVLVETLAYQYSRKPPKITKLRDNVIPCLCSIECDFARPIEQSPYKENISFRNDIERWTNQTSFLYIWDYTVNFSNYTQPFPNVLALQDNIKFFVKNKTRAIFEQGNYQGIYSHFGELKAWLIAKWLWNPELPLEDLLNDFFNGVYGPSAGIIRKYFNELHARQMSYSSDPSKPLLIFEASNKTVLSDDFLEKSINDWQQALLLVKPLGQNYIEFIQSGMFGIDYVRSQRKDFYIILDDDEEAINEVVKEKQIIQNLLSIVQNNPKVLVAESKPRRDSILESWSSFLTNKPVFAGGSKVEIGSNSFSIAEKWGEKVNDPNGLNEIVIKLYNTHYEWALQYRFSNIRCKGKKVKLKFRAKVDIKEGVEGQAFWSGVYDIVQKKALVKQLDKKNSQIKKGWQWYEFEVFEINPDSYYWFGPGRFDKNAGATSSIEAAYFDRLEIQAVSD